MTAPADIDAQVEALASLDLAALRETWRRRIGAPPAIRSRDILCRMLAFELQAGAYGGLSAELRQKLRRVGGAAKPKPALQPGTTITREWRGARHVVEVTDQGFAHMGTTYATLSEVARAITGARWSGPRFFGLADAEQKKAA